MNCLEHRVDRLEHGSFEKGIARRNLHDTRQNEGHYADILSIAPARRFKTGSDACALVLSTLGERAVAAGMTFKAGNVVMQGNSISEIEPTHTRAPADDS